jgi:hypothetical protein
MRWLRRSQERDDRKLVKRAEFVSDVDPIDELGGILGEVGTNGSGGEKPKSIQGLATAQR